MSGRRAPRSGRKPPFCDRRRFTRRRFVTTRRRRIIRRCFRLSLAIVMESIGG